MKNSTLALSLFSAVFCLLWAPSAGQKTLHLGSCVISTSLQKIRSEFSEIRDSVQAEDGNIDIRILRSSTSLQDTKPSDQCCLLRHLLRLYLDRVFKNYQTSDPHTLRKISSLSNSFLTIKKDLRLCHDHKTCHCGEEATEKYSQILSHFEELELQAAVVKALGELDILLQWLEETK
ncbi:PREDICTED: interleukin-20 [Chrysochloris asiatica]|uniref:Interleukin family protein n=1 Tax=Chrysochloris asiatica TaxID=185453 RepID=A0A9B0T0T4_CHRAS|nr:PREDICTED: interleukin-20 [Chrysochloris asiatica]